MSSQARSKRVATLAYLMAAGIATAAPPPDPPSVRGLPADDALPGIYTYRVDDRCRITAPRKLQGPETLAWRDVERALDLSGERTVWRMVDGDRRQFFERRVTLSGEMIQGGELYCLVTPMGQVFDAWILRTDPGAPRQRLPQRLPAVVRDGALADLGTFSVIYPPEPS